MPAPAPGLIGTWPAPAAWKWAKLGALSGVVPGARGTGVGVILGTADLRVVTGGPLGVVTTAAYDTDIMDINTEYEALTWAKLLTGPEEEGALREETEAFCLGSALGGGRALVGRLGVTGAAGVVGANCWNDCCWPGATELPPSKSNP